MRKILHVIVGCLLVTAMNAQTPACTPDTKYKDSIAGPYPRPYDAVTYPSGGIDKPACLGKPYNFVFTIKVGDSITVSPFGLPLTIALDSITVSKTTGLSGLPTGLSYACFPANCAFPKNSLGCVVISGTTATSNTVKDYPLIITGKIYTFLTSGGYDITFPGSFAPGDYKLKVLAANDAKCTTSAITDLKREISSMTNVPNPFGASTTILIESNVNETFDFDVFDIVGNRVIHQPLSIQAGSNTLELSSDDLPNGMYIYSLTKGNRQMSNKFIINK